MRKIIDIIKVILDFFYSIFSSKIFIFMLVISLMMGVFQVSTGYREEILLKEQEMFYEYSDIEVKYYFDARDNNYSDNTGINSMISCYQKNINLDEVPGSVRDNITSLNKLYGSNSKYFNFLYYDLFSGFTVSYNADRPIFTASTIKAPAMIYIYELASRGEVDLNEKLIYTSNFYRGGSGVLKTKPANTSYTIEELVQYTIYESDNIAYSMLMNRFGRVNIRDFWRNLGSEYLFENDTIWGYMSANDALIYMKELYRFSHDNEEYGVRLLNHFKNAKWKLITDIDGEFNTANKGGWSNSAIHDIAIVFDDNPYILIVMSNMGESSYSYLFNRTSKLVGSMHLEYWKYKVDMCSNIKLY